MRPDLVFARTYSTGSRKSWPGDDVVLRGRESVDDAHSAKGSIECRVQERRAMAIYYTKTKTRPKTGPEADLSLLHHRTGYSLMQQLVSPHVSIQLWLQHVLDSGSRSLSYPSAVASYAPTRSSSRHLNQKNPHSAAHLCFSSYTTACSHRPGLTSQPS
jgi:hypothetical protein